MVVGGLVLIKFEGVISNEDFIESIIKMKIRISGKTRDGEKMAHTRSR